MTRETVQRIVTPAEREVWRRYAEGEKREYIASTTDRSLKTVDCHIASVKRKLKARCAQDLVRAAVRYGVITVEVVP